MYAGGVQQTIVSFEEPSAGASQVTLVSATNGYAPALDGKYAALLQGGVTSAGASITQTAQIPSGMETLLFEAQFEGGQIIPGLLEVSIDGQGLAFSAIGTEPNYTLHGADIESWAGDTVTLAFTAPGADYALNSWVVDDISFSPNSVVPEPNSLVLMAVGGIVFAAYRRLRNRCMQEPV